MAEVAFPGVAELTAMSIEPWYPGQVVHESPFTGAVQVLNRAYASWRGSAEIARMSHADETHAQAIEAFLSSLSGQGNWTALPLNRPTIALGQLATVSAIINDAHGTVSHTLSNPVGAKVGNWVQSGTRVYVIRAVSADGLDVTLDPQAPLGATAEINRALTIRARAQNARARPMRRTPEFWGPWRFDWQEAF